ncbi:LexA/Signal peptidase [Exidia glandulosa HHB12029]|uniref:Mitochondrial inner membrane protease subunit 2 n=1 Tax=Exidia glandulosa HHB12029 TaxID=1314781 RepID=A0A165R3P4_EXIGL|nr:LexA/Signal peptidase [Exidia glandulosa HHB12029]
MASTSRRMLNWISWAPLVVLFEFKVATIKRVDGRSMSPTFNPDPAPTRDIVLFERGPAIAPQWWYSPLKRGDIVYLKSPTDPDVLLVKRIVALEGDVVVPRTMYAYPGRVHIPPGHAWVEGDEPLGRDSNAFGPVSCALFQGRAACIVWPPSRIGAIPVASEVGDAWSVPRRLAARERERKQRVVVGGIVRAL